MLEAIIDRARQQFPRLFFLSNQEVVELLGVSRNPRALQPFAKKCFQGVIRLVYDLPVGTSSMNSALDYALNGESSCCAATAIVCYHSAHKIRCNVFPPFSLYG